MLVMLLVELKRLLRLLNIAALKRKAAFEALGGSLRAAIVLEAQSQYGARSRFEAFSFHQLVKFARDAIISVFDAIIQAFDSDEPLLLSNANRLDCNV